VIFEGKSDMTVLSMDESMYYYGADVDTAKNIVTISGEFADPDSRSQRSGDSDRSSRVPKSILTYS
jgi:hypothetical protein